MWWNIEKLNERKIGIWNQQSSSWEKPWTITKKIYRLNWKKHLGKQIDSRLKINWIWEIKKNIPWKKLRT